MKGIAAVPALLGALALAGCTPSEAHVQGTPQPNVVGSGWGLADKLYAETIILPDGRTVTCVVLENRAQNYSYGGVSCDWDSANNLIPEEGR
ncbi:hypothetical protein [Microbacterium sp.]|uniref:hypothetical protein n=1 Tax=Microbacterium sp. TaxID=51671 RepID=UPI0039E24DBB